MNIQNASQSDLTTDNDHQKLVDFEECSDNMQVFAFDVLDNNNDVNKIYMDFSFLNDELSVVDEISSIEHSDFRQSHYKWGEYESI